MNENERTNHWYWKPCRWLNFVIECKAVNRRPVCVLSVVQDPRNPGVEKGKAF